MTRTRRSSVLAGLIVAVLLLAGAACSGKITKRGGCQGTGDKPCKVLTVDDNQKERWRYLTRGEYKQCQVGEQYPACGEGNYGGPSDPEEDRDRDQAQRAQEEQERRDVRGDPPGHGVRDEDCNRRIQVVVGYSPDGFVRVEWTLEDRNGRDSGKKVIHSGAFSRTRTMCPGGLAKIQATDVGTAPDTMICLIRENGVIVKGSDPTKIDCRLTYIVR
jgi:hypothetical protein